MCHSVGVSRTSSPFRVTRLAARSTVKSVGLDDCLLLARRGSAERRPQAGEQLVHSERLRHVVVRAGVERLDLGALRLAHRQDDDRNTRPPAKSADHFDAVDSGEPEIEDDEIGVLAGGEREGRLARRREVDVVPPRLQIRAQRT